MSTAPLQKGHKAVGASNWPAGNDANVLPYTWPEVQKAAGSRLVRWPNASRSSPARSLLSPPSAPTPSRSSWHRRAAPSVIASGQLNKPARRRGCRRRTLLTACPSLAGRSEAAPHPCSLLLHLMMRQTGATWPSDTTLLCGPCCCSYAAATRPSSAAATLVSQKYATTTMQFGKHCEERAARPDAAVCTT